jgi:hypothetical protein
MRRTIKKPEFARQMAEESTRYEVSGQPIAVEFPQLTVLLAIISHLQLAVANPEVQGIRSTEIVRRFIDQMIQRIERAGYPAFAEAARMRK